jgi:hypothetical protein
MPGPIQHPLPPRNDRCLLLELPRELRDLVYLHTLTHDGGIAVHIDKHKRLMVVRGRGKQGQILSAAYTNPLVLVCQQVTRETNCAICKANCDLALYSRDFATPSSFTLDLFTRQLGLAAITRLRKVAVNGSQSSAKTHLTYKEVSSYFHSFMSFCEKHPQPIIVLRFRHVGEVKGTTWLRESMALKAIIRGPDTIAAPANAHNWWIQQVFSRLGGAVSIFQRLPTNLRFSILDAVPESDIRKELGVPPTDTFAEGILRYVRELWEEGI